jgi:protein ImuB
VLWLALHFPLLPLEALPLRQSPSAVVAGGRVLAVDPVAAAAGVEAGQKRSTALGLAPRLRLFERDAAHEAAALEHLACWGGRFTPSVVVALPDGLLLEVAGCRRLFGSLERLATMAAGECAMLGWSVTWAVAPTPLGARWLARAGYGGCIESSGELAAALADLPCGVPGWPAEMLARLEAFGIRQLGGLAGLPRSGLRRRLGGRVVDDWLRASGELPDPQAFHVFPERFAAGLDLPSRVEHAEALAFAGQRLLATLAGWLHARRLLIRACTLHLGHDDATTSVLDLRMGEPGADEGRLLRLLREHLGCLVLKAPVERLELLAEETFPLPGESASLFGGAAAGEGRSACLERLRARLGDAAVRSPGCIADHRPECATAEHDPLPDALPDPAPVGEVAAFRPLWLLPEPQPLAEQAGGPCWQGSLQLLSRPERLESGWWDSGEAGAAGDVRRDYFVARNPLGQWAWIFRDARGWFLHGLFA